MTKQVFVYEVGFTRLALTRFGQQVNALLSQGYAVYEMSITRRFFWYIAYAVLEKDNVMRNGD